MSDEFLSPSKYCRWSSKAALVKQAKKLARRSTRDTITEVYRYVATRFAYDTEKAKRLNGTRGYVPSPEATYAERKGICFDKASLMCAMLRSLGIPAKLVVGTMDGMSHAWVSAFDGKVWNKCDPTMLGWQVDREYVKKYEL